MAQKPFKLRIHPVYGFFSTFASSVQIAIAVLPVVGLLLRFGQDDLLGRFGIYGSFIASGANEIFAQLPLIFAIALAMGFSKDLHGSAGFAGAVSYLVFAGCLKKLVPGADTGILGGILCGILAGLVSKHFAQTKLPSYLEFFSGRRAVPIIAAFFSVFLALFLSFFWANIALNIKQLGEWMTKSNNIGLFFYGVANRLLLPLGLHNVLNAVVWFQVGEYITAGGEKFTGEIARYMNGDPTAGHFMAGFFPVMMFGLPAACLAMTLSVPKEKRKIAGGIFFSVALTSLVTGITEPVEYAFMFVGFPLYCVHAVLTGLSLVTMNLLNARLGFTFSAGAVDFFLNSKYGAMTGDVVLFGSSFAGYGNMIWAVIVGLVYGLIYFLMFSFVIRVLKIRLGDYVLAKRAFKVTFKDLEVLEKAKAIYLALGGFANIKEITSCATRLRVTVVKNQDVDEIKLKKLAVIGVLNSIEGECQVIVGTDAMPVCESIDTLLQVDKEKLK